MKQVYCRPRSAARSVFAWRVVPVFRCILLPDMPPPKTPGSSNIHKFQSRDVDIGLRRCANGSALPIAPANPFRAGGEFRGIHGSHICYGLSDCSAPCTDLTGFPAIGAFYFQASNRLVALPGAGYNYSIDWTPMLAGLSPAGMAARLAARHTFSVRCAAAIASGYSITFVVLVTRLAGELLTPLI